MKDFWQTMFEATKEPLRLLLLSAIPVVITWVGGTEWKYAAITILILRWLDKVIYEWQKNTAELTKSDLPTYKGLIGF